MMIQLCRATAATKWRNVVAMGVSPCHYPHFKRESDGDGKCEMVCTIGFKSLLAKATQLTNLADVESSWREPGLASSLFAAVLGSV